MLSATTSMFAPRRARRIRIHVALTVGVILGALLIEDNSSPLPTAECECSHCRNALVALESSKPRVSLMMSANVALPQCWAEGGSG